MFVFVSLQKLSITPKCPEAILVTVQLKMLNRETLKKTTLQFKVITKWQNQRKKHKTLVKTSSANSPSECACACVCVCVGTDPVRKYNDLNIVAR